MKNNKINISNLEVGEVKKDFSKKELYFQFNDKEPEIFMVGNIEKFSITLSKSGESFEIESTQGDKFKLFLK